MEMLTVALITLAASLVTIGTAYGISKIGVAAMDGMARQPEVAPKIQTGMLIASALIEGVALFCAVICLLAVIL